MPVSVAMFSAKRSGMNATSETYPVPGTRKGMLSNAAERASRRSIETFLDIYRKFNSSEIEFKAHVDDKTIVMRHPDTFDRVKTVGKPPDCIYPDYSEDIGDSDISDPKPGSPTMPLFSSRIVP